MHNKIAELSMFILCGWWINCISTAIGASSEWDYLDRLGPNTYRFRDVKWGIIQPRDYKNDQGTKSLDVELTR